MLRVNLHQSQITALSSGATVRAWEPSGGSSAFFTPPSPTTTEALSQPAPMGQSSFSGCQWGCQRAHGPIRRELGSKAGDSHALRGLHEGTFGGERKNIEGWNQREGPTGTSCYLFAKKQLCFPSLPLKKVRIWRFKISSWIFFFTDILSFLCLLFLKDRTVDRAGNRLQVGLKPGPTAPGLTWWDERPNRWAILAPQLLNINNPTNCPHCIRVLQKHQSKAGRRPMQKKSIRAGEKKN